MKEKKVFLKGLLIIWSVLSILMFRPEAAEAATVNTGEFVVVLDPGHGGIDSGSDARHNGRLYLEADMNWKIANYTKQELKKYTNIKVILTRTKNTCPSLKNRVATAKKAKADILVSMHINSEDSGYAKGACVLISRGNYRPSLAAKEKKFGTYVMNELGKLGIAKRNQDTGGMLYRLSSDGSRYPNGKIRDYYQIVYSSVENNLPGVIIEHAFISSYSDVSKFLSSDAKLKKIGQADARAIVSYIRQLPAKEEPIDPGKKNGWIEEDGKFYYYKNNVKAVNKLLTLDGKIYYVNADGVRQYGWQEVQGKTYYFREDGSAVQGWMETNGDWYYFNSKYAYLYKNVKLVSGSGNVYLFGKDGKRLKGWTTFEKKKYYVGSKGYALRGFQKISSKYYYFDAKDAYLVRDKIIKISSSAIYYIDANGIRFDKVFKTVKNNRYYFNSNGKARIGWLKSGGKYYYFNKNGIMLKNTTMKDSKGKVYRFNSQGICTNRK